MRRLNLKVLELHEDIMEKNKKRKLGPEKLKEKKIEQ